MILRSLEIENFRKFREPLKIEHFADGLNIVVEPNETGKSTLLEALRAAFFIRYSAKTELVRSYVPFGDDVAPRVKSDFVIGGQSWILEKQFMRAPFIRLTGSSGRRENDAAEEALQELLGFERGNNRGNDVETRGPLGMLWVEQAKALRIENPSRLVRDSVRSVLEAEVGAVTGGRRFDGIRAEVDRAYAELRTVKNRQSRGDLLAAETRVMNAKTARIVAEDALRNYDLSLSELESAKTKLRLLEREIIDPEVAQRRRRLEEDLRLGESAALRLSAEEAHHGRAVEIAKAATAQLEQLVMAETRLETSCDLLTAKQTARDTAQLEVDSSGTEERRLRAALEQARIQRESCESVISEARQRLRVFTQAAGLRRAVASRNALTSLEERERELQAEATAAIVQKDIDSLAELERLAVEARARFNAGIVKVDFELAAGVNLGINDELSHVSSIDIVAVTRLTIGHAGKITIRPPADAGQSMEANLVAAEDRLATLLKELKVTSHGAALARSERAATAARELKAVQKQIAVACPGDPTIGLPQGADALRAFVASAAPDEVHVETPDDDIERLESELIDYRIVEAAAQARHEQGRKALSETENGLAIEIVGLTSATQEKEAAGLSLDELLKKWR